MINRPSSEALRFAADDAMTITDLLPSSASPDVSLVTGRLNGLHAPRVNHRSAKVYLLLGGSLTARTPAREVSLEPRDLLMVHPGEEVTLEGDDADLVIVCSPGFDPADEKDTPTG
ncbi:hypothetical protein QCN29_01210 [Streptomyces sp. HNM0663]|uniref:Uncharacterized protein n=1 Tax=Streptomyces chengmaiensis TaxID=3040919 RepID=A0ABT6HFS5_9ACTN|nr:hypothetical protein [Streptomyces chengmaiensis]MDH2387425.1 hypothetical protein [Streptomyces chengmaiensis]